MDCELRGRGQVLQGVVKNRLALAAALEMSRKCSVVHGLVALLLPQADRLKEGELALCRLKVAIGLMKAASPEPRATLQPLGDLTLLCAIF